MAEDRLHCCRSELIVATRSDGVMSRATAISRNPFQNASSRLTLVLRPGTDPAQENWRVSFRGAGKPPCLVSLPRDHPARPVSRPILRQWSSG
jgi:hypothetical protein